MIEYKVGNKKIMLLTREEIHDESLKKDIDALKCSLLHWNQIIEFIKKFGIKHFRMQIDIECDSVINIGTPFCSCCIRSSKNLFNKLKIDKNVCMSATYCPLSKEYKTGQTICCGGYWKDMFNRQTLKSAEKIRDYIKRKLKKFEKKCYEKNI